MSDDERIGKQIGLMMFMPGEDGEGFSIVGELRKESGFLYLEIPEEDGGLDNVVLHHEWLGRIEPVDDDEIAEIVEGAPYYLALDLPELADDIDPVDFALGALTEPPPE